MTCALPDVNVLIALVDSAHLHHEAAHQWLSSARRWATCPITENAFVRILSSPRYPTVRAPPQTVVRYLRRLTDHPNHRFVPCDVTIGDAGTVDEGRISGSKALTDVYLVALAHAHGMRLVTFDRRIRHDTVVGAPADVIELVDGP